MTFNSWECRVIERASRLKKTLSGSAVISLMIPSKWKDTRLADVIDVKHGYAFDGQYFRDDPSGDVLLTPGNFSIGGGFKSDKFKYYIGPVHQEFVLDKGDLIVTMTDLSKQSDTLGYPALIPHSAGQRFLHNQRLGKIVIKDAEVDKRFLYYLLCSDSYRDEVLASATGTTVKHTSPNRIKAYKFTYPPVEEQRGIAHVLSTLDDKIESNRRMNETLEAMAQAFFEKMKNESEDSKQLDDLVEINSQTLSKKDEIDRIEYIEISEVSRGNIGNILVFQRGQEPSRARRKLRHGDTVLSTVRPDRRSYFLCLNPSPNLIASTGFAVVSPIRAPWSFIHAALTQEEVFDYLGQQADGGAYPAVRPERIVELEVPWPTESSVVEEFHQTCAPLYERAEHNRRESRTLATLRDTLLPKLLLGEVRVLQT